MFGLYNPPKPITVQRYEFRNVKEQAKEIFLVTKGMKLKIKNYFFYNKSKITIVYFHGNGSSMDHDLDIISNLCTIIECNVFYVEYRGYGPNRGFPNEVNLIRDGENVLEHIRHDDTISKTNVYLFGTSLGGALVLQLLPKIQNDHHIKGIIIQNTFTTLPELVQLTYPNIMSYLFNMVKIEEWNNVKNLDDFKGKRENLRWLLLSSEYDSIIPHKMMQEIVGLVEKTQKNPKKTVTSLTFERNHNNIVNDDYYYETIYKFIYPEHGNVDVVEPIEQNHDKVRIEHVQNE